MSITICNFVNEKVKLAVEPLLRKRYGYDGLPKMEWLDLGFYPANRQYDLIAPDDFPPALVGEVYGFVNGVQAHMRTLPAPEAAPKAAEPAPALNPIWLCIIADGTPGTEYHLAVRAADKDEALRLAFELCDEQFSLTLRGYGAGKAPRQSDSAELLEVAAGKASLLYTDWEA